MKEPIDQDTLRLKLAPVFSGAGRNYAKFREVLARSAQAGEVVVSITSDGEETVNRADDGDYVVENQTDAREKYIVSAADFRQRYQLVEKKDATWSRYLPTGKIRAILVDANVARLLEREGTFHIMAAWDAPQRVEPGDYLASPLPDMAHVYRIGRKEFEQTYKAVS